MKYAILGSGSKANSYIFSNGVSSCIVDNGYSFTQFSERLRKLNFDISNIKFILLTHTHKDHISGIKTCAKKLKIPVYIFKEADYKQYFKKDKIDVRLIEVDKIYNCNSFSFIAFKTSHDATGSVSYSINSENFTFTIITDTGKISKQMYYYAKFSDVLFLEANYNPQMLIDGPYPQNLKKRIQSAHGHLSNHEAIEFLNNLSRLDTKIKIVYFCHLSEINNSPEILYKDILNFGKFHFNYIICPRDHIQNGIDFEVIENFNKIYIGQNYFLYDSNCSKKENFLF